MFRKLSTVLLALALLLVAVPATADPQQSRFDFWSILERLIPDFGVPQKADQGPAIDPDGQDTGSSIDPSGLVYPPPADQGPELDPDGLETGSSMDPDGR